MSLLINSIGSEEKLPYHYNYAKFQTEYVHLINDAIELSRREVALDIRLLNGYVVALIKLPHGFQANKNRIYSLQMQLTSILILLLWKYSEFVNWFSVYAVRFFVEILSLSSMWIWRPFLYLNCVAI